MQTDPSLPPRPFRVRNARDLGTAVRHFRTQAGLSQAELATRAGLHRTYVTALEGGHTTEALERVMQLLHELGLRIAIVRDEP